MHDLNFIRTEPETIKTAVRQRQNPELAATVDEILALDLRRRELLKAVEALKAERNTASKAISRIKDAAEREAKIAEQKGLGEKIAGLDEQLRGVDETLQGRLRQTALSRQGSNRLRDQP